MEGFGLGGNANLGYIKTNFPDEFKKALSSVPESPKLGKEWAGTNNPRSREIDAAYQVYLNHAGEIESRETEKRMEMNADERQDTVPFRDAIPMDEWVVRKPIS